MLIHYNTKILILWRHTSIQWKFIWQHFWTLKSMVALSRIPFSRCLLFFSAFNEKRILHFVSFRSHVPEKRITCNSYALPWRLSLSRSVHGFNQCVWNLFRWREKKTCFVFNVTSCISAHVAMRRIQNANTNSTEGISMILQIIL